MNYLHSGRSFSLFAARILAVAAVLGLALSLPADARPRPKRSAAPAISTSGEQWKNGYAAIVVDANTGKVLHESNADAPRHPASITKVMTLYLLFEQLEAGRLRLDSQLPVSARAAAQSPTKLGLPPGATIAVEDAIKAVVTRSANDIAVVIAEAIGGDEASFAAMMTRKARALGMSRTTFRNASGLPNREQITSARDLALLGRAIQERFPRHYRYFSTRQFVWRGNTIGNHNRLLGRIDGVDGIKTGYTRASGFNLVTSARRDGRHIVGVVMGGRTGASRDAQMAELIESWLPRAYAGAKTAPRITEVALAPAPQPARAAPEPARVGAPLALAARQPDTTPTPPVRPAPGSTEPLRPNAVRSVSVGPITPTAPLGAVVVRASAASVPTYTTSAAASGSATPAVITVAEPAPRPDTLDAQAARFAPVPALAAQLPTSPGSATTRGSRSEWMIQIGAFPAESQARNRLREAQSRTGNLLGSADPFTEKVVKGSTALYRARFAGFDEERAREVCRILKKSDFACMPLKN